MRQATRSRRAGLARLLLLVALAGCGGGGIGRPDPAESARKQPLADAREQPPANSAGKAGGPAQAAAVDEAPAETNPSSDKSPDRHTPAAGPARAAATPAATVAHVEATLEPKAGEEAPAAGTGNVAEADVAETVEAAGSKAAPAVEPAGGETAGASGVGAGGEEALVAEPPPDSKFWLWFLTLLATALVGTAAWFFLQPPWKRGRWWRLFKTYVSDWQSAGLDETPPAESPSLEVFSGARAAGSGKAKSEPGSEPLRILERPQEQASGPETSLHLEDLSEEGSAGATLEAKKKSTRHGDALKLRGVGSAGKGSKSRKPRRKRNTNVTLPVISRDTKRRKKG